MARTRLRPTGAGRLPGDKHYYLQSYVYVSTSSGPRTSRTTTSSSSPRAHKTSDSSKKGNRNPKVTSTTLNVSSETCHNRILHYQVSESKDSTSSIKSISISCNDSKKASPMTSQCKYNSELGLRSFVNKYYVQNQAFSDKREKRFSQGKFTHTFLIFYYILQ